MSKALSRNACWLSRSGEYSTHGSKRGIPPLGFQEDEWLSPEQERAALVAYVKRLDVVISSGELTPSQRALAGHSKRRAEERIHRIRPQLRKVFVGLESFIIEVLRERLTKAQYQDATAEARRRFAADQAARGKL